MPRLPSARHVALVTFLSSSVHVHLHSLPILLRDQFDMQVNQPTKLIPSLVCIGRLISGLLVSGRTSLTGRHYR